MKRIVRPRLLAAGGVVLAVLALSGCGRPTASVSGKVTYRGQPVPGGRIFFVTEQGERHGADLGEDGSYSLNNVPAGTLRVGVDNTALYWLEQTRTSKRASRLRQAVQHVLAKAPPPSGRYVPLPAHYRDPAASGLRANVRHGSQQLDFNLP
jgi:hypothetical protein